MASVQGSSSNKSSNTITPVQGSPYTPYGATHFIQNNQVGKCVAGFRTAKFLTLIGVIIIIVGIQASNVPLLSVGVVLSVGSIVMCAVAYITSENTQVIVIGQTYPNTTVTGRPLQYNYSTSTGVGGSSMYYQGVPYPNGCAPTGTGISSLYSYPNPPQEVPGQPSDFPPPYDASTTLPPIAEYIP